MLSYRIEDILEMQRGSPNKTLVLEASASDFANCALVVEFLSNAVADFFAKEEVDVDCNYPIFVEIDESIKLSELGFWILVLENAENGIQLIADYVSQVMAPSLLDERGKLCYNDPQHFIFSYPLIAGLDRLLSDPRGDDERKWNAYGKRFIEVFFHYLQLCDFDFETFQDDYIYKVIDYCWLFDDAWSVAFLGFRVTTGQLADKNFDYLNAFLETRAGKARLKHVIDYILGQKDYVFRQYRIDYERICSAVYGNQEGLIEYVLRYVEAKIGSPLDNQINSHKRLELQRIKDMCDVHRNTSPRTAGKFNTGFHTYDYKEKKWMVNTE